MPTSYANPLPDPAASVHENDGTSEAKRKKVRRGTRSCWECRRRKMKCIFSSPADKTCSRCHRRGVKCVGQDYPEEITPSLDRSIQMADRIMRVEALVEQLLKKVPNDSPSASAPAAKTYDVETHHGIFAPAVVSSEPSQDLALFKPLAVVRSTSNDIAVVTIAELSIRDLKQLALSLLMTLLGLQNRNLLRHLSFVQQITGSCLWLCTSLYCRQRTSESYSQHVVIHHHSFIKCRLCRTRVLRK